MWWKEVKFKVKDIDISTGGPYVVVLNKADARELGLDALDRVRIKFKSNSVVAAVDISENLKDLNKKEIGMFEEVFSALKVKRKQIIDLEPNEKPKSIEYIKNKLDGFKLNQNEINEIVKDVVNDRLTEVEKTYFVSACYKNGLSLDEVVSLTNAIVSNSKRLKLKNKVIIDKHSTGGVCGNRITMIVVPIIAAAGLTIPKTSSRAITSPAGTADTMEVFCNVSFNIKKLESIIKRTNGCMVWGGALDLASADDKLIKIEKPLRVDPRGIMLASIMAKKKAVGATHVLIDMPVGKNAKIKSLKEAKKLEGDFLKLGNRLGIKIKCLIGDGSEPIGNGIGPALEAIDVLKILRNENGPEDLKRKSLKIAGMMLEMVGIKDGEKFALEILENGEAYKKFKEIVKAQGGKVDKVKVGKFKFGVKAWKSGIIKSIDNKKISRIARMAGAPDDKGAGVYLNFKRKSKVKKGNILFIIYSENKDNLKYVKSVLKDEKIYTLK